jgi:hypothetical protein
MDELTTQQIPKPTSEMTPAERIAYLRAASEALWLCGQAQNAAFGPLEPLGH